MEHFAHALFSTSIAEQRRGLRALRRVLNKGRWRAAVQERSSAFAQVLRQCERALGDRYICRERDVERGWVFFARDDDGQTVIALRVAGGETRTNAGIAAPVNITLFDPALVDVDALRAWNTSASSEWHERAMNRRPEQRRKPKGAGA